MFAVPVAGLFLAGAVITASAHDPDRNQKAAPKSGGMSCCAMMGDMKGMMGGMQGMHGKGGAANALPLSQNVEGMTVVFDSATKPPRAGKNGFAVRVRNAAGQPVTDARVTLALSMPSMNMGGPTVTAKHAGDGVYKAAVKLSMTGPWQAKVSLVRPGQRTVASTFDFPALQKAAAASSPHGGMTGCPMMAGGNGMKDCPLMGSGHTH